VYIVLQIAILVIIYKMIVKNFFTINIRPLITISIIAGLLTICSCSLFTKEIVPDSPKELLEEGIKAIKLGQNLRARTVFTQLIEDFPDSKERTQALLILARSHYSIEEYEEAKFIFKSLLTYTRSIKISTEPTFIKPCRTINA